VINKEDRNITTNGRTGTQKIFPSRTIHPGMSKVQAPPLGSWVFTPKKFKQTPNIIIKKETNSDSP
jgi:hypothetical protein